MTTEQTAPTREMVLDEIDDERIRQDRKWGEQNHPDGTARPSDTEAAAFMKAKCQVNSPEEDNWRDILEEEVYETFAESDPARIRHELIQVAAVAVAWIEAIDRRPVPSAVSPEAPNAR
jgi:hypothetical protein